MIVRIVSALLLLGLLAPAASALPGVPVRVEAGDVLRIEIDPRSLDLAMPADPPRLQPQEKTAPAPDDPPPAAQGSRLDASSLIPLGAILLAAALALLILVGLLGTWAAARRRRRASNRVHALQRKLALCHDCVEGTLREAVRQKRADARPPHPSV